MSEDLPKINLKYIRKVLRFIENGPRLRLDMGTYHNYAEPDRYTKKELRAARYPACGTKACFAGWGVMLQLKPEEWKDVVYGTVAPKARKLFGFTMDESDIVFAGEGMLYSTFSRQLRGLKESINTVLRNRGMKERI